MTFHSADPQPKPPIYFMHIEKTGGTSLTNAIAALFPAADVFRNSGSISLPFLASIESELTRDILIAGHAQNGVARKLMGKARIITMMRDPEGQAVSHYFHARLDARHDHHADALNLSFFDYISRHPRYAIFQLWALEMAITEAYYDDMHRLVLALPRLKQWLWTLDCVGVLDRQAAFCRCVSAGLLGGRPIMLPHLNSATSHGVAEREIELARDQYRDLAKTPVVGKLIELERQLYDEASAVADHHIRSVTRPTSSMLVRADSVFLGAARFRQRAGVLDGGIRCDLAEAEGHLVYGPYIPVPAGRHEAEFHFDIVDQPAAPVGRIILEVVARDRILACRTLKRRQMERPRDRRLSFTADARIDDVEFRISADGFTAGRLRFDGVSLHRATSWLSRTR